MGPFLRHSVESFHNAISVVVAPLFTSLRTRRIHRIGFTRSGSVAEVLVGRYLSVKLAVNCSQAVVIM